MVTPNLLDAKGLTMAKKKFIKAKDAEKSLSKFASDKDSKKKKTRSPMEVRKAMYGSGK